MKWFIVLELGFKTENLQNELVLYVTALMYIQL